MSNRVTLAIVTLLFTLSTTVGRAEEELEKYWPQWRGPAGTGSAEGANPPVLWAAGIRLPSSGRTMSS